MVATIDFSITEVTLQKDGNCETKHRITPVA